MTFAIAANKETCASPRCNEPVEIEVLLTVPGKNKEPDKEVSIGYCLECAAKEGK